jgi:hypothetical protein
MDNKVEKLKLVILIVFTSPEAQGSVISQLSSHIMPFLCCYTIIKMRKFFSRLMATSLHRVRESSILRVNGILWRSNGGKEILLAR